MAATAAGLCGLPDREIVILRRAAALLAVFLIGAPFLSVAVRMAKPAVVLATADGC